MATGISLTDYSAKKLLDHLLAVASYSAPAGVYLALFTVTPTDSTGGTEVTGGSYAREAITFAAAAGSPRSTSNSGTITFTTATADWGTVVAIALMDASSGGNMLAYGALTSNQSVANGQTLAFAAGAITFLLD